MFQVRIDTAKGMHVGNFYVTEQKCALGKNSKNDIVLHGWKVSSDHALLSVENDGVYVQDLESKIGTKVNGKPVKTYGPVAADDVIEIHNYRIQIANRGGEARPNKKPDSSKPGKKLNHDDAVLADTSKSDDQLAGKVSPVSSSSSKARVNDDEILSGSSNPAKDSVSTVAEEVLPEGAIEQSEALSTEAMAMHDWRVKLRKMLHEQMDLRRINVSTMSEEELRELAGSLTRRAIEEIKGSIPNDIDLESLREQVVAEAVGLGPLEPLIAREDVSEIMVNSCQEVFFETGGKMYKSDVTFTDDQAVQATIERIVTPVGRRIDESSPMVDARLKDGSRVNAIIPPLALKGSSLTIRKFMKRRLGGKISSALGLLTRL